MKAEALEKMLARGQDSAMLRFGLGKAYLDDQRIDEAAEHLQRCVEQDPTYSAAWALLGKALLAQGYRNGAELAWQSGIDAAVENGDKQSEKQMTVLLNKLHK